MSALGQATLIFSLFFSLSLKGQNAKEDYHKLTKELQVRELSTLMFAKYNDANIKKIETFLKKYPKAPEREKALYLRAYSIWSLHRYKEAPPAYRMAPGFPWGPYFRHHLESHGQISLG